MKRKLYLKVACGVCEGGHLGCPYCDETGKHFIEASDKTIKRWLRDLADEEKEEFRAALEGK